MEDFAVLSVFCCQHSFLCDVPQINQHVFSLMHTCYWNSLFNLLLRPEKF